MVKMVNRSNIIIILMEDLTILLIIRYMTRVLEFGQKTKYYSTRSNTRVKYNFTERFYTEVSFGISRKETKGDS